jgi:hypothetical protein
VSQVESFEDPCELPYRIFISDRSSTAAAAAWPTHSPFKVTRISPTVIIHGDPQKTVPVTHRIAEGTCSVSDLLLQPPAASIFRLTSSSAQHLSAVTSLNGGDSLTGCPEARPEANAYRYRSNSH